MEEFHNTAEVNPLYQLCRMIQMYLGNPNRDNLCRRPSCHTVSNAFLMSRKATKAFFFHSCTAMMVSWSKKAVCMGLLPRIKPPWSGWSLVARGERRWSKSFSKTLVIEDRRAIPLKLDGFERSML